MVDPDPASKGHAAFRDTFTSYVCWHKGSRTCYMNEVHRQDLRAISHAQRSRAPWADFQLLLASMGNPATALKNSRCHLLQLALRGMPLETDLERRPGAWMMRSAAKVYTQYLME